MRKLALIGIILLVIYLSFGYRAQKTRELGENLIANAYSGDLIAVKDNLEHGAPLAYTHYLQDETRGYGGVVFNALQAAASSGNEDLISFLIDQGLDINTPTPQGWTPLFIAVRDGQPEAAKLLIYRKADLNAQTDRGATALMMAVSQKFPSEKARQDLLAYMLKRGANPNQTDAFGNSALYYAAALQKPQAAQLLYEYGAAPSDEEKQKIQKLLKGKKEPEAKEILQLLKRKPQPAPQTEQN